MHISLERRDFLKTAGALGLGAGLLGLAGRAMAAPATLKVAAGCPNAEKLGWRLGCQAYSFNRFTFYEAIDKIQSLGLHYVEAYPGQKLSAEHSSAQMNEGLSPALRTEVKKKLADSGVKLVNFGVCGLSKDEKGSRRTFDFAKDMGIETIVSEPAEDAFDLLDKLTEEYQINVALHNHPKPSRYWNPDTVLKACKGHSKRIGSCSDTGHWMRSGINPIEALKKLQGHIISFHFKDLNQMGGGAHDVPWGTGKGNAAGMLAEIHRQGIKAVFSIEYEYNWTNSVPEIAQCVVFFDKTAAELAKS